MERQSCQRKMSRLLFAFMRGNCCLLARPLRSYNRHGNLCCVFIFFVENCHWPQCHAQEGHLVRCYQCCKAVFFECVPELGVMQLLPWWSQQFALQAFFEVGKSSPHAHGFWDSKTMRIILPPVCKICFCADERKKCFLKSDWFAFRFRLVFEKFAEYS